MLSENSLTNDSEKFEGHNNDYFLNNPEIKQILENRNFKINQIPGLDYTDIGEKRKHIDLIEFAHHQEMPNDLPKGYFFEGGVARSIVLKEIGENVLPPRDVDIVGIDSYNPDPDLLKGLSEKYMTRDYQAGYGATIENKYEYFKTRDFVLNEVLVDHDKIIISKDALLDLKNKIIRPTEFERGKWQSYEYGYYGTHPKLIMKSLRLLIEFEEMYGEGKIQDIEEWQWNFNAIPCFYIGLALDKAQELGDKFALNFYLKLLEYGVITEENTENQLGAKNSYELALNIRWNMHMNGRNPFNFTEKTLNKDLQELNSSETDDNIYDYYEQIAINNFGEDYEKNIK